MKLQEKYKKEIVPNLMKEFGFTNPMQVPRLDKVIVNTTTKEAVHNPKVLDAAAAEMQKITGQKPVITRARKSIATYKLRGNMPIGVMVTLRGPKMYDFVSKLINVALPRVRDFKGVSPKAFDGRGNYSLGLQEQIIFPEIDFDKLERVQGMNIAIVTTAKNDAEGKALLKQMGMPFRT
jgi:large subunit ribosomal protein L5